MLRIWLKIIKTWDKSLELLKIWVKGLDLSSLWIKTWESKMFLKTMSI